MPASHARSCARSTMRRTESASRSGRVLAAPVLALHGGAGPSSVAPLAGLLAASARVVGPVHPGFRLRLGAVRAGERPCPGCVYRQLLGDLDINDVCAAGNAYGGWIAAELAIAEMRPT